MEVKVTISDKDGIVLATILGTSLANQCEDENCEHDGHFIIDHVRSGIGVSRSALADLIIRDIP